MTASESSDQARAAAAGDWAICCSGGGIRSAAYCLGALQSLEQRGLAAKARWILGVSGGSYIAASRALVAHYLPGRAKPGAYAPGTPEERNIGLPVSYGCIRMRSNDIINLYDIVGLGAEVTIVDAPLATVVPALSSPSQMAETNRATMVIR